MLNKRVSEKVIWEDSISPDNEASLASLPSQLQIQPQMTFCYKCNKVIPSNSKYCPYCQTELYVVCPKCGEKYSSQYPSCSQCGTNRREYLEFLRKEQERKKALEAERRRQAEIAERKRLDEERIRKEKEEEIELKKSIERYRQQEASKKQKEEYLKENAEIMKTKEYELLYSLFLDGIEIFDKSTSKKIRIVSVLFLLGLVLSFVMPSSYISTIYAVVSFPVWIITLRFIGGSKKKEQFLLQYISGKSIYDDNMITYLIKMIEHQGKEKLSECCVIAYRKRNGLPICYSFHSLR